MLAELPPQLARADAGPGGQRVQIASSSAPSSISCNARATLEAAPARGRRRARFPGGSAGRDGSRPPCGRGRGVKTTLRDRRARRTDRTAVDARGLDRGEEASVVAGVAHADGAVAGVVIEVHAAMLTPVRDGVLRFSDRVVRPTDVRNREQESGADPIFCCECLSWPRGRRLSPAIRSLFLSAMEVRAMSAHLFRRTPEDAHRRDAGADRRADGCAPSIGTTMKAACTNCWGGSMARRRSPAGDGGLRRALPGSVFRRLDRCHRRRGGGHGRHRVPA